MYIGEYSSLFSKAGQNNIHVIKKERERVFPKWAFLVYPVRPVEGWNKVKG
jgi:hypothetical protein